MQSPWKLLVAALLLVLGLVAAACADDDPLAGEDPIDPEDEETPEPETEAVVVGSADFTESIMLAEMFAQRLEAVGVNVDTSLNIGAREVYFPALQQGELDILPEYTGALLAFLTDGTDETDTDVLVSELRDELEPEGVTVLGPSEAENRNSLVVTPATADEHDLETVSDLAPVADELVLGGPPEYRERRIGLPGLEEVYGITFADFRELDAGGPLTIEALESGEVDVAALFTTQGVIGERGWVVLEEDKPLIPAENIIAVAREEALTDEMADALTDITDALTTSELTELNRRMEVDNEDPDLVAQDWLEEQGLLD